MACLSTIRLIQALILVYSGAHPVSGNYRKCMCEEGNPLYCSQVRCPGSKCGDFIFSDNLNCTCKTVMTTAIGCQLLRINGCDLEFEFRSCSELHPFICSDSNYNFQIYQDEKKNWTEAVKTCESRDLQIARINFSVIHSSNNVSFWTGTFYGLESDNDTDVSHCQILTPEINTTSTGVKCKIKPEVFRMTTTSATPSPRTTSANDVSTGRSRDDKDSHHGNVAAIAGAISAVTVLVIVGVLVIYVRKIRPKKKTRNNDIQLSDTGLAEHADQLSRGRSRDNGRSQYYPEEHINTYGQKVQVAVTESCDENVYDHFKRKNTRRDVESGVDTYGHAIGCAAQVALKD